MQILVLTILFPLAPPPAHTHTHTRFFKKLRARGLPWIFETSHPLRGKITTKAPEARFIPASLKNWGAASWKEGGGREGGSHPVASTKMPRGTQRDEKRQEEGRCMLKMKSRIGSPSFRGAKAWLWRRFTTPNYPVPLVDDVMPHEWNQVEIIIIIISPQSWKTQIWSTAVSLA